MSNDLNEPFSESDTHNIRVILGWFAKENEAPINTLRRMADVLNAETHVGVFNGEAFVVPIKGTKEQWFLRNEVRSAVASYGHDNVMLFLAAPIQPKVTVTLD